MNHAEMEIWKGVLLALWGEAEGLEDANFFRSWYWSLEWVPGAIEET